MKRKVVQQGPATLMVSLPSKWVKQNNIHKGDLIEVTENNDTLVLGKTPTERLRHIEIRIKDFDTYMSECISRPYEAGFDEMVVSFDDPRVINKIKRTVDFFLGFDIVEQGPHHCVLKNIAQDSAQDLPRYVNKTYMSVINLAQNVFDKISKADYEHLEELASTQRMVQKFCHLCLRIINKHAGEISGSNTYEATKLYVMLSNIYMIGDIFSRMCKDINKVGRHRFSLEALAIFKKLVELLERSYHLYSGKHSQDELYSFTQELATLGLKGIKVLGKGNVHDSVLARRLFSLRSMMYPLAQNLYWPESNILE
ncbi:MAG: AbrB/MazE/SpoVT family DNA-binding domain-containing protein [Candidatus Woesearchaeota archaeon]